MKTADVSVDDENEDHDNDNDNDDRPSRSPRADDRLLLSRSYS